MSFLKEKKKILRVNLKIDLGFWVFVPYREVIRYVIDDKAYLPISYRWLCFAVIIVREVDLLDKSNAEINYNRK